MQGASRDSKRYVGNEKRAVLYNIFFDSNYCCALLGADQGDAKSLRIYELQGKLRRAFKKVSWRARRVKGEENGQNRNAHVRVCKMLLHLTVPKDLLSL